MSNYATVTPLNTAARTPNLGVGVQSLYDSELTDRIEANGMCVGADADAWFPSKSITRQEARDACAGCPVIAECLERALRYESKPNVAPCGIWGGTADWERRNMLRDSRRLASALAQADVEEVAS